ncbi:MAG: histidine phosphatase family protein [Acidimicrobiia bacterium]|nr:histidine phosphatase family protein [Acidimicrobiia bacterium]
MTARVVLVRHGETEWSRDGRHTGRTDLDLTARGERDARAVGDTLAGWAFGAMYASPLRRAVATARLAGFACELDDDLREWDYGDIEGRRHEEILAEWPGWSKWNDGVPGGETADEVGARADRFLDRLADNEANVVVFAHGHLLAVMIARWLGLDADQGRRFPLATGSISVLGVKRAERVLESLNVTSL